MVEFLDLKKQYLGIKDEIDQAIAAVINESAFIGGKYVKNFEEHFAAYQQVKHCIGVANGTDAIEIALEALDIPKGSEVVVPANSFIASSEAVTRSGHKVVFCDFEPETYTISINDFEKRITPLTKAVVAVHLYGQSCEMSGILELAKRYNLRIIEDCAQSHGAEYKGCKVGSIGDIGTFSFYPGKNLGAYGDGGAIVTNDDLLAKKCRMMANHGRIAKYDHEFEGRNSRLDGLQAAILAVKLKHLERWIARRSTIAERYGSRLMGNVIIPSVFHDRRHVYHLYVVRVKKRDDVVSYLNTKGISTGIHYPTPLPFLNAYCYLGYKPTDFPVAYALKGEILSLPIHGDMPDEQVDYVIKCLQEAISQ